MSRKTALGKGIESLIKSNTISPLMENKQLDDQINEKLKEKAPNETGLLMVNPKDIKPNQFQPRKIFKDKELLELAESIKENGILQPLVVTRGESGFELVAGERRLRAAKLAK